MVSEHEAISSECSGGLAWDVCESLCRIADLVGKLLEDQKQSILNPNSYQKAFQAGVPEQMMPSGNAQVVKGPARVAGPPPAITVSLAGFLLLFVASRLLYVVLIHPSYLPPQLAAERNVGT